jgi:hypothetical protein
VSAGRTLEEDAIVLGFEPQRVAAEAADHPAQPPSSRSDSPRPPPVALEPVRPPREQA